MNNSLDWSEDERIGGAIKRKLINEIKSTCDRRIKRKLKCEPPRSDEKIEKSRCKKCNKKVSLANRILCKCDELYCPSHRFFTEHDCPFDYRQKGIERIKTENKKLTIKKLDK
ncbi:Zinc finger A20 and AN1 domain-containing stress-associated protein 10 [Dictyocoela muelleri]|nr:Zinc finger A20 and AN1 domain-containing stress-associated protein 10 [Dictyocoela muelleri]